MRKSVDYRAIQVLHGSGDVADYTPEMLAYKDYREGKPVSEEYEIAFDLYEDPRKQEKVDSLIIGGCPDEVFVKILQIPLDVIRIYKALFFDSSVLRTYLDKLVFAESYATGTHDMVARATKNPIDNLVLRGLNNGYEILITQYCNVIPKKEDAINILKKVQAAAMYKAAAIKYSSLSTNIDKRAMEHAKLSLDMLQSITKASDDESISQDDNIKFMSVLQEVGEKPADFDGNIA